MKVLILALLLLAAPAFAYEPGDAIPAPFAPPWDLAGNLFLDIYELDVNASIESNVVYLMNISDKDRYLFNTMYYSLDGSQWLPLIIEVGEDVQEWLPYSAAFELEIPASTRAGFVIAYTCKRSNGEWLCGCRAENDCGYWQLQQIPIEREDAGPTDCRFPENTCPEETPFCNVATGACNDCMLADTSLCGEEEACVEGACTHVECTTDAHCAHEEAGNLRKLRCHPTKHTCVPCLSNVDCIWLRDAPPDLSGTCDTFENLCSYVEHCIDECMPIQPSPFNPPICEIYDGRDCERNPDTHCFEFYPMSGC